jgi:hypothetical protein
MVKLIDLVDLAVVVIVLDKPRSNEHIEWHKVLTVVAKVIVKDGKARKKDNNDDDIFK